MTNGAVQRPSVVRAGRPASGGCGPSGSAARSGLSAKRIGGQPARCRVAAHRVDLRADRVDRPAAEPAAGGRDEPHVAQPARAVGGRALVQQEDGQVRRDRVVAAGVHDPRAGLPGDGVDAVDRLADEQHLAGQVRVVRPGPGARLDQRQPVPGVRADGRHDRPGRVGERGERRRVGRVRLEERPLPSRPATVPGPPPASPATARRARSGSPAARARPGARPSAPRRTRWRRTRRGRSPAGSSGTAPSWPAPPVARTPPCRVRPGTAAA